MAKRLSFNPVDPKVEFPKLEEKILAYWQKNKIFEKSLEKTKGGKKFVFYEGPPTANGKPGIHHVLARSFKDLFPRYHTMKGDYCLRRGGWDTHGLPVELEVEKELGVAGKKDIENLVSGDKTASIAKFNELCRKSVFRYVEIWKKLTERMGFWIDIEDAYVTLSKEYVESCWAILKEFWVNGLLEEDYKVVPYCPRCGTPLSSHELSLGYQETKDPSIYIKFALEDEDSYFLVWTTTPWTLPANVALAINPNATYVKGKIGDEILILAKDRLEVVERLEVLEEIQGKDLIGKRYKPIYNFHDFGDKAYQVYPADFVSLGDGTGIVHTAVMYGADDFELGKKVGLPIHHLVGEGGKFTSEVTIWKGEFVKDADPKIVKDLKDRNLLLKEEKVTHSYPFCWRCKTPLLYYAVSSWFIRTTKKKDEIIEQNKKVNWVPRHIKNGRMGKWLEGMVDWSLSRFRYWGTPLPVWQCKNGHIQVVGSYDELYRLSNNEDVKSSNFDPHRPYVDNITFGCNECGEEMRRVTELIDVWFDSGAMPFAQWHYPFENKDKIDQKEQFPADFIAEGQDQTRGWFYTLLALSTLYKGQCSYKNVISHNLVLDDQGRKMSKSLGNIVDPMAAMDKFGADSIRFYFYSAVNIGLPYRFDEKDIEDVSRQFFRILWNVYNFFVLNATVDNWSPANKVGSSNVLDRWILSRFYATLKNVESNLDKYDPTVSSRSLQEFVNDLSLWFVRRSRDRIGPNASGGKDKEAAYYTLWAVLVNFSKVLAPFAPYISEEIYQNLTKEESVHLTPWPEFEEEMYDKKLEEDMFLVRKVVEKGHSSRKLANIPVRQSLGQLTVKSSAEKLDSSLLQLIKDELNIKEVVWVNDVNISEPELKLDTIITPELEEEGKVRELARQIQEERKKLGTPIGAKINVQVTWLPKNSELLEWLKKRTLAETIEKGEEFKVESITGTKSTTSS